MAILSSEPSFQAYKKGIIAAYNRRSTIFIYLARHDAERGQFVRVSVCIEDTLVYLADLRALVDVGSVHKNDVVSIELLPKDQQTLGGIGFPPMRHRIVSVVRKLE